MTISHIKSVLTNAIFVKHSPPLLGRWSIDKSQTGLIVDYSNEDHCGACGEYIEKKKTEQHDMEENEHQYYYEFSHMQMNTPDK